MSGNCGDDNYKNFAESLKKLSETETFFQAKLSSSSTECDKIFGPKSDVSFLKMMQQVQKFLTDVKSIGILPDQLQIYTEAIVCILNMVTTIINMESIITLDEQSHKARINRIRNTLKDIAANVKKYLVEVENLGSLLKEIMKDDDIETKKKKLETFDFNIETLATNIEFGIQKLIVIKEEIQKGSKQVTEYLDRTKERMADVRSVGWSAVKLGGLTATASGGKRIHNEARTETDENAESGKGASWGEIIGGAIAVLGGIAMAGSAINTWVASSKADKIKKEYEDLTFNVKDLEVDFAQLKELMENHKRRRPNVQ